MKRAPLGNLLHSIEEQAAREPALTDAILDGVEHRLEPLGSSRGLRGFVVEAGVESLAIVISIGLASLVFLACLSWFDLGTSSHDLFLVPGAGNAGESMTSGLIFPTGLLPVSAMARLIGNGLWVLSVPLGLLWFALRVMMIPVPETHAKQEETLCGIQ